ncbi:MAG TPA: hypothetical protein VFC67_23200 [Prolixibacteraceae bacterium]|nr:hypothetical protein [Prolixibacteraceae bacterium]
MKKFDKINVLFQIFVLYCFVVSTYSTAIFVPDTNFKYNHSTREDGYSPIVGTDIFTITTKPENIVIGHRNLPTFSFKNHPNDYQSHRKAAEAYLVNTWSEYILFTTKVVIRLQPADIVFPFHSFW